MAKDIDEARRAMEADRAAHTSWERFRCQMRGHRGPKGWVASHTYIGKNETETVTYTTPSICDLCGGTLPQTCGGCGRRK